jgi:hypothetical protein
VFIHYPIPGLEQGESVLDLDERDDGIDGMGRGEVRNTVPAEERTRNMSRRGQQGRRTRKGENEERGPS